MTAAARAGIETAGVDLSHDGQMLLVDRFDVAADGTRMGFEDVASLMGLRVREQPARHIGRRPDGRAHPPRADRPHAAGVGIGDGICR